MLLYTPCCYTLHAVILFMLLYPPCCYTLHAVILSMLLYIIATEVLD